MFSAMLTLVQHIFDTFIITLGTLPPLTRALARSFIHSVSQSAIRTTIDQSGLEKQKSSWQLSQSQRRTARTAA